MTKELAKILLEGMCLVENSYNHKSNEYDLADIPAFESLGLNEGEAYFCHLANRWNNDIQDWAMAYHSLVIDRDKEDKCFVREMTDEEVTAFEFEKAEWAAFEEAVTSGNCEYVFYDGTDDHNIADGLGD